MIFARRRQVSPVPEVGDESPKFQLPSAQGGQLQLNMRTACGPVVVVFYRPWSGEDVAYFEALSEKEEEINLAAASVVGIGISGPDAAQDFVRESGIKSYVLYDYAHVATREWGLLERSAEHGEFSRPAVFIVSAERKISHAWVGERPAPEEILAKVSELTGLPKPEEEDEEEKPEQAAKSEDAGSDGSEKRRAGRRAAREGAESGQQSEEETSGEERSGEE